VCGECGGCVGEGVVVVLQVMLGVCECVAVDLGGRQ